jgi:eukaryotic-like serine/threonine-protein kinase
MTEQVTVPAAVAARHMSTRGGLGFADLSPEIQHDLNRRLGGVALVYAGTWIANFLYFRFTPRASTLPDRILFWYVITAICAALGVVIYLACRSRRIPARAFADVAVAFEIVAALGIMASSFGWERYGVEFLSSVARALDIPPEHIVDRIVQPLDRVGIRLLYVDGVTWVSVWLLVYPLVVPAPMGRTIFSTLLTAATVPVVMLASLVLNGVPDPVRTWVFPYLAEATIPTFICAGIAIFGARVVYRLTRDLSKAQRMGSYELVEKIGAGGMGEVWKAKHRMLVRPAAIKLIRPETLGTDRQTARTSVKRFEREAQATSRLSSPHSIALYDFGITDEGTFYYVMELLEGIDLKTMVEKHGPVSAERAIHILRQACHSLADAHLTGMVHRDVKPGNIFVVRCGADYDFVKVLDFGLVKRFGDGESSRSQLTMEGIASGTPGFMAPEMISDSRLVDPRSDIYSLGCVAYWLLTGQLVFTGETSMAILLQHVRDQPVPPSARTDHGIPAELEQLVLACLSKDPAKRPQGARELSHRLVACAASLPAWSDERASDWWQTHLPHMARAAETSAGAIQLPPSS